MFKPMLAATLEDPNQLQFPVIVSPKLDGLRCIIRNSVAVSRNLKPFRNSFVQAQLANRHALEGLDGELIVGDPTEGNVLGRTQSGIMSEEGAPDFTFWIFDSIREPEKAFKERFLQDVLSMHERVRVVQHQFIDHVEQFYAMEQKYLLHGYEGIMIRHPHMPYKYGRSTLREGGLIKYKRFTDGEGLVMSLEEGVINENELQRDELGRAKRTSHQENMQPSGKVGTLHVKDLKTNELVAVSPGRMTHDMREHYWKNPTELVGSIIKYRWFDYGRLDAPRFATFQALRSAEDL